VTKILIVDDKTENLYLLQSMLETNDFKIISAKNGAEALGLMKVDKPDLIITDILMPVMDGFTLCRECKNDASLRDISFFFYTATYTDSKDEEYAMSLGADRFILKPQEPDVFLKIIYDFLGEIKTKTIRPKKIVQLPETTILKEYNEVLIRKIEDKMVQTEKTEKELKKYAGKLEKEILEHKRSEDALRESQHLFQTLASVSPVGIFRTDRDGSTTYVNPKWSELSGLSSEEASGSGWLKAVHPDDRENLLKTWENNLQSKNESSSEYRFLKSDGNIVWVMGNAVPELIDNKVNGYIGTITDITEIKRAEQLIIHERRMLRTLIDNLPDLIYIKDIECRKVIANSADIKQTGFVNEKEVLGKTDIELYPGLIGERGYADDLMVIRTGNPIIGREEDFVDLKGEKRWLLTSKIPLFGKDGKITGLVGIGHDITERKLAEEVLQISEKQLSTIYKTVGDVIYYVSIEAEGIYRFISVSQTFYNVTGLSPEMIIGKLVTEVIPEPSLSIVLRKYMQAIEEKTMIKWVETSEYPTGKLIGEVSITPVVDNNGLCTHLVGSVHDITNMKLAEEELIKAKNKAEESDRLKTAFLHNISHEIRTPMNAIVGFTALLSEPGIDETSKALFIDTITQSSDHLLAIINDIIEISNIEAGILKYSREEVNINKLIHRLYDQFSPKAIQKNLVFLIDTPLNDREAIIILDKTKFVQILSNLLTNAIKFTEKGIIKFGYITAGQFLNFYVSDTGIGIAGDQLERIFDRFYQVEHTLERHFEGTGLGLSISKAFVELLGGRIWVESELGKGSSFYFSLPLDYQQKKSKPGSEKVVETLFNKQATILIAEDDDNNFNLIDKFLSDPNLTLVRAKNGLEAVTYCEAGNNVDLVLMDLKMPVMDGYEATARIKSCFPDLIIIAQTAYVTDKEKAFDSGCIDIITKPFKKADLLEIVKKYLKA
jgi:PAS domain S-box-containing protein